VTELTHLTIAEARDGLKAKAFSATELAQAHVDAVGRARALNAFVLETPDKALAMAGASDERLARGEARPLEGIPLGVKDLFCTEGTVSTAGSKILGNFNPPYESTVTRNLWNDGAVMLGKLNMDEFAMGSSNETSAFGPVVSPWRREGSNVSAGASGAIEGTHLVPGGSSGGSAAAVAARLCLAATATDTGGSIRQPAAFTGTVGIKPTYGRCSRWGTVAFASSLDQAGPDRPHRARRRDPAALHGGPDPKDTTCADLPVPDFEAAVGRGVRGLRSASRRSTASRACRTRSSALGRGRRVAEGRRRRDRRGVAAAHQVRAAGLLHRGPGGGLLQPRPLRRRALRPAGPGRDVVEHVREDPRGRLRAARSSAGS
jgi:aspartyl-tRNA(Asn)/glutamyl-tRNA(Gln) amidotransferase subunit A